ncbi:MAG: serine/threonine-protein kinase, partial [Chthoniobacteraceae bacterium]
MAQQKNEACPECGSVLDVTGAPIFASRTCPVCGAQIHVCRRFGHYELQAVMGQGGQGTVYRAIDENLNRPVALKVLRTEHVTDPKFVKQFEHEAQLTASINHPNVVRVFSSGAGEDGVFLAMELVDGGTFDDLMEKLGRVPEARALQIGIQIAQGLRAGLEKGMIHRDVKPGNILFAKDGTAKIVDFGLAVFLEYESQATGDIWGTPYYLSPERLNRQQEDFRSDIYSLGAALFHAIAGRPPFEAEDASHVALKHLTTQAVSIQTFAPDVTNATAYVINRTLAKNPTDRQASYDEFIEQLQFARDEAMARNRSGGKASGGSRVVMEDADTKRATNLVAIATFVVLALSLVVGGVLLTKMFRGNRSEIGDRQQAGPAVIESFGPGWAEAKAALVSGDWAKAAKAFNALAAKHPADSPERDWAIVHEALAEQFGKGGQAAEKILGRLPD